MVELRLIDQNDTFKKLFRDFVLDKLPLEIFRFEMPEDLQIKNAWINELTKTKEPKTWESIRKKKQQPCEFEDSAFLL